MKYLTNYVPQEKGGMSAGYVVVEDNGVIKAQKLSFDGTTPQFDGVAEEITDVGIFETGLDEPAYSGGGGTAKYYKCSSVDTSNKTWTGYELVLQDGVYIVSDTLTEDLIYTGFTPVVGTIYNEDTTLTIGTLFSKAETLEGCVFAANMQTTSATYNGETVTLEGITLADAPGYTDGTKALANSIEFAIDGATDFANGDTSIVFSLYLASKADSVQGLQMYDSGGTDYIYVYQPYSAGSMLSKISWQIGFNFNGSVEAVSFGWHHVVIQNSGNNYGKIYIDGVLAVTDSSGVGYDTISQVKSITRVTTNLGRSYMKDLQIYNRVLSEDEIATLYEKAKLPTGA